MSSAEKAIARMRNNPTDVSFDALSNLLHRAGCTDRSSGSSHHVFRHPTKDVPDFPQGVTIPFHRPVKKRYVLQALDYYDALMETDIED